jgi:hypothetical protein
MPKDQGGMYGGSTKSVNKSAYGNDHGGNYGKKIGDKGMKTRNGNKRTRCAADRYK